MESVGCFVVWFCRGVGFDNVSFLRALRAFRPFRIMVRFKKIKVVLGALLRAIPGLFNTFLFCILFWFVLSILGVNWYNGLYRHCRIEDEILYATPNDTLGWVGCADYGINITTTEMPINGTVPEIYTTTIRDPLFVMMIVLCIHLGRYNVNLYGVMLPSGLV